MPQFIIQTPWYMGKTPSTSEVKYEKNIADPSYVPLDQWYKRGISNSVASKYRNGACENCGANTHKTKDCCERPRKVGAKYSNRDFAPDEYIGELKSSNWDIKRDTWNGYNPAGFKKYIDDWNKMDARKREFVSKKPKVEDEKVIDDDDKGIVENELKMSVSSTVLRIREDTAKYLRNLDENSAFYNGKTRSMIEPKPEQFMNTKELYWITDQFEPSKDYYDMIDEDRFADEARIRGNQELNPISMPSQSAIMNKNFKATKGQLKSAEVTEIEKKYGSQEKIGIPKELEVKESEEYTEYSTEGKALPKNPAPSEKRKSKYEADGGFIGGHTYVWGSYWHESSGWGYQCCYSHNKYSVCEGEKGKRKQIVTEYKWEQEKKEKDEREKVQKETEEKK